MYYHHSHQLRNFTISFILNVARDLTDLQTPPQACSIKNETDSDTHTHIHTHTHTHIYIYI